MPLSSSRLGLCFWSGTAGFSFDAFGYVLKAVSQKGHWPGAKALPEMQAYFANRKKSMPSQGKAIIFHRVGIFGVEYLGMIRKMDAINGRKFRKMLIENAYRCTAYWQQ